MKSPLGEGPEFDRIRAIAAALTSEDRLGDDCAVIGSGEWLASTDVSVEGVHFRRAWLSLEEIGWRAAASALSDLAAMGAEPSAVLVALAGPRSAPAAESVAIMRGIGAATAAVGAEVVGG
ncbi:MAG TPA: AIR synthase related protein, partial [Gemmatimonadales bacterium]|nr:AIR synthase related protein [Gemmatimonadales bacterium]